MTPLENATSRIPQEGQTTPASADDCAAEIMETIPLVMRAIREQVKTRRPVELSVAQFRTLIYLSRHRRACLSDVAEHAGLTLPTTSKMIDGLVRRELVSRRISPEDRRRVMLKLTPLGQGTLDQAFSHARERLAAMLTALPENERSAVVAAMRCLQRVFSHDGPREGTKERE